MKILILSEEPYPFNLGGGTSYLKQFEKALDYSKIDYEIVTTRLKKPSESKKVKTLGASLITSRSFFLRSLFKLYYFPRWFIEVFRYLSGGKMREFDIINSQDILFSGILGVILSKVYKKPLAITRHGILSEVFRIRMRNKKISYTIIKKVEDYVISKADVVFCVGRHVKDFYLKTNRNSVFIPNFIDLSEFKGKERKKVKVVAYTGRLSKEKNVDLIVRAAKHFPKLDFWIIGSGPEEENLKKIAREIKSGNVRFFGYRGDVPKLLEKVDVLILLCKIEGFGLSAIEAIASGIPVIAADVGEMHYFVGEKSSGVVIPVNKINTESLKLAIINAQKNCRRYSKNALNVSRKYDYKIIIKEYTRYFKRLCNQKLGGH